MNRRTYRYANETRSECREFLDNLRDQLFDFKPPTTLSQRGAEAWRAITNLVDNALSDAEDEVDRLEDEDFEEYEEEVDEL